MSETKLEVKTVGHSENFAQFSLYSEFFSFRYNCEIFAIVAKKSAAPFFIPGFKICISSSKFAHKLHKLTQEKLGKIAEKQKLI